ncbi:zinc-binding oxidoreductase [Panaeolus papilionaceus]|nr:zinc-binding oxidoreductase [Panaeolus papilionaceus]
MRALITSSGNTAVTSDIPLPEPASHEIRLVGNDVTNWRVGDRVAGLLQGATSGNYRPGGFAEYVILEEDLAIRVPEGVSFEDAATYPLCSLTAAQALFIRLEINAAFESPFQFDPLGIAQPSVLIYSAATSVGLFTLELLKLLLAPSGKPFKVFATASPKHHDVLLAKGVDAVFDYRSPTWVDEVKKVAGEGIHYAIDCISEDESTAMISHTFNPTGGKIAVLRKFAWNSKTVRKGVKPLYGAAWAGLGHEIIYNNEILPASPSWRAFTVAFYKFLSSGSTKDPSLFPIAPNPVRLMPGGLDSIVSDGFSLLGSGKVADREVGRDTTDEPWMKPIAREKLVYKIVETN